MAKKLAKVVKPTVAEAPKAEAVVTPDVEMAAAPLTKRNRTPSNVQLVRTDKAPKDRADHNKAAWDVISKALPATATELIAALEAAKLPDAAKVKLVSFPAYISYMIRRKALAPKAD